jgi:NADH dehydrogenase
VGGVKRVAIIGGGFAGLAAARALALRRRELQVVLIDRRPAAEFLPLLPDMIGRGVPAAALQASLPRIAARLGCAFVQDTVVRLDLESRALDLQAGGRLSYDAALVACGVETEFYGQQRIQAAALKLNACADAAAIREALQARRPAAVVVAGGGYTGIEVATHVRRFCDGLRFHPDIVVIEPLPAILNALPVAFQRYAADNLGRMRIEALTQARVAGVEGNRIGIIPERVFNDALLIWTAGVGTPAFVRDLPAPQNRQGRLEVDPFLRVADGCFAAGDAAAFAVKGAPLRMAVQFAVAEGCAAARNILDTLDGRPLRPYRPRDLGYVIPMANRRACGKVLGLTVTGRLPVWLHYGMCIFRAQDGGSRRGMLRALCPAPHGQ